MSSIVIVLLIISLAGAIVALATGHAPYAYVAVLLISLVLLLEKAPGGLLK